MVYKKCGEDEIIVTMSMNADAMIAKPNTGRMVELVSRNMQGCGIDVDAVSPE